RLQRAENIGEVDAERLHLLAIEIEIKLWRAGAVGREHPAERRILIRGKHQPARDGRDLGRFCATQALELEFEARAGAKTDDRRQVVGKDNGLSNALELTQQPAD